MAKSVSLKYINLVIKFISENDGEPFSLNVVTSGALNADQNGNIYASPVAGEHVELLWSLKAQYNFDVIAGVIDSGVHVIKDHEGVVEIFNMCNEF